MSSVVIRLIVFLSSTLVFWGQNVTPPFMIGLPLTRTLEDGVRIERFGGESFRGQRSPYMIGAGLATPLRTGLDLDAGVLYQRVSYDASLNTRTTGLPTRIIAESSAAADRWQIPVLMYHRMERLLHPFAGTGVNFSVVSRLRGRTEGIEIPPTSLV